MDIGNTIGTILRDNGFGVSANSDEPNTVVINGLADTVEAAVAWLLDLEDGDLERTATVDGNRLRFITVQFV